MEKYLSYQLSKLIENMGVKSEETSPNMNECLTFKEKLFAHRLSNMRVIGSTMVYYYWWHICKPTSNNNAQYTLYGHCQTKKKLVFTRGKKDVVF